MHPAKTSASGLWVFTESWSGKGGLTGRYATVGPFSLEAVRHPRVRLRRGPGFLEEAHTENGWTCKAGSRAM